MLHILSVVSEFYALQSLEALILQTGKFEQFRHSHEKWEMDFRAYQNAYNSKLANAINDYTLVVCAGEARHAWRHANFASHAFPHTEDRSESYRKCTRFSYDFIKESVNLIFDNNNPWEGGYGGRKWGTIAKSLNYYHKIPDVVYIDHTVDLSHNNSVFFDKGADIFTGCGDTYQDFLDYKRYESPKSVLSGIHAKEVFQLIDRAIVLQLIPAIPFGYSQKKSEEVTKLFHYHPISWGSNYPSLGLVPTGHRYASYEEEDRREREER